MTGVIEDDGRRPRAHFEALFGHAPAASASAPGRVNLLGEHTDYNQGLVLPLAIPRKVAIAVGLSPDDWHCFHSMQLDETVSYQNGTAPPSGFASYLYGCIEALRSRGHEVPALLACVDSDVPIGSGLSSSAALEVATLRGLRELLGLAIDDEAIAILAHEAETKYVGVNCGILDQMASSFADTRNMLFLDTRSRERRLLPLPTGAELLIVDSGESRSLATSGYNQRRAECERAADLLGVESLRDVDDLARASNLPAPLDRRVRHVVTENARVLEAAAGLSAKDFGTRMNASHASLSADYEVSTPALDELAAVLQADDDTFGAKLTGAGFGGACVALVRQGRSIAVGARAMARFQPTHPRAAVLLTS